VSLNSELTVRFSLGGSATNGIDYRGSAGDLPETFIIPAGSSNATLTIQPMPANDLTGAKSVVVTLSPSPDYQVGSPGSAVVTIEGNSVPARALAARKGEVRLEWLATTGGSYRIICKDNPLAPVWTSLPAEIQPSSTNAFYQEAATTSRFYRVYQSR
jgi:hypothetical protein